MFIFKFPRFAAALCAAAVLSGCAAPIERWIVNTRVHQGDVALARGNARDAEIAYHLAMRVDPRDPQARAGFVSSVALLARIEYSKGSFDDALAMVEEGLAVDPQSAALAALKATLDEAKLQREIVISNYPTYRAAGLEIQRAYKQLNVTNELLLRNLRRFGYTFDTDELTNAIKRSYELQLDLAKDTNRLVLYRQLVSSGVPEAPSESTTFGAGSLLPLP
jgi:tetratricopeptide (TPR) repeat protein